MSELSNLRKRRGAAKASVTKLTSRLAQLESKVHEPSTFELAQQLLPNLTSLDTRFKEQHFSILDHIDESDAESLSKEQEILDKHDEDISTLLIRVQQLIQRCSSASETGSRKILSRSLADMKTRIGTMESAVATLSRKLDETHLYHHYQEQVQDFKRELGTVRQNVLSMNAKDVGDLSDTISGLDKQIYDVSIKIKEFLYPHKVTPTSVKTTPATATSHGVKLPKLDVPTFDGDILNWTTFWEQFCIAVHDRTHLTDAEKLAYLRHSLKDGTAKTTVEGLSHSGDQYTEAVGCLKGRYDRPKLIHQAHVKKIVDIPTLKDGSGKELRRLHDTAQQHIRALKALGNEPDGPFITSFLQLKLDSTTLFEWQKHDQESAKVSGYEKFLDFINLRAQASECLLPERNTRSQRVDYPRRNFQSRSAATFTAGVDNICVVCKRDKHALFTCPQFKSLTRDKMMSILRSNNLCVNCLKPGHFAKQCPSSNRCRKCDKSHHTLIHSDSRESQSIATASAVPQVSPPSVQQEVSNHTSNHASTRSSLPNTLLMTCQVQIVAPDGTSIKARALLDSGSTMSFVSERIVQSLGLSRQSQQLTVSGIGGMLNKSPLSSVSTFGVSSLYLPMANSNWSHISKLPLADPDFATPGKIDVLLGADIYADVLLQGRRSGPPGTPTALETRFGWVLSGKTQTHSHSTNHTSVAFHHTTATSADDILRRFWEIEEIPRIMLISLQRNAQSCNTLRKVIHDLIQADSLSLFQVASLQLHGFSDASENAYGAVVYLRITDTFGKTQVSLVASKTKVAPIKKLTIPRLELCGAYLLAQLLYHIQNVFHLPLTSIFAWTDSTIVLSWLVGNPRRFKTYVGNRVSHIVELIAPERWNHVEGIDNPADCVSRGMFPSELLSHQLWWYGPQWLNYHPSHWPKQSVTPPLESKEEERELSLHTVSNISSCLLDINHYSSFTKLKRVTSWVLRFIQNCRSRKLGVEPNRLTYLTTQELYNAELYWCSVAQRVHFMEDIKSIKAKVPLSKSSSLLSLQPLIDSAGLLRVGGRQQHAQMPYSKKHPIILHHKHYLTHLIIRSEHSRLLHAGPTLLMASLNNRYYILGYRKIVRSITRGCITCRKLTAKPSPQMIGQLPIERLTPGPVFDKIGIDFAGPVQVKYAYVRKPVIVKSYVCLFVSLTVKAVHLEPVSDLTTDAFLAALRRFTARRGKPSLILSDHGTNFTGASRELKEIYEFLNEQKTKGDVSEFCAAQCIEWRFIPERAPHFGGLWEAAVKSMKHHFKRVVGNTKLTFEELTTILTQIESCLNSRPLAPLPHDEDSIEALTPGHFLIRRPLESIPDPSTSYSNLSLLKRWYLCQSVVRHFWKRWSAEYLSSLRRHNKWKSPSRNIQVGDIVILQEDNLITTKWPLAKVIHVHPGADGLVRVATVKTSNGIYRRPIAKLALLLPDDEHC